MHDQAKGRLWRSALLALAVACATPEQARKPPPTTASATPVEAVPRQAQLVPFQGKAGFTVLMPPTPYESERTESTPGGAVHVHLAQAHSEMAKYLASVSDFPKGSLDRIPESDLLDSLQQSTIQSMHGTLVASRNIEVAGLRGREFSATDPEGSEVTARILLGDSRVYTVAGTYPKGAIPATVHQFLDSFQPTATAAVSTSGASVGPERPASR